MTKSDLNRRSFLQMSALGLTLAASSAKAGTGLIVSDIAADSLRASQTTPLGLYLSPTAAHAALQENPEILFVDVRDPIEITFVGHPAGLDRIIPLRTATHEVDPDSGQYKMVTNENLVNDFDRLLTEKGKTKTDPLFVSCRSGSRSASVARTLIEAGYTNVWNLTEGFEGDKDEDGVRAVNGWRNAGLPWSYELGAGVAWTNT